MFQMLRATKEVTRGTYQSTPPGSAVALVRLVRSNGFPGRPTPLFYTIRSADSTNRIVQQDSGQVATKGSFTTCWWFSQSKVLVPWATTLTGSPLELPSLTLDHALQMEDSGGTLVYRRYLGCVCSSLKLRGMNTGDGIVVSLDFDFDFLSASSITSTDFPTPALSAYPTDKPVIFQQLAGGFALGTTGQARTSFSEVNIDNKNITRVLYDESKYPQAIRYCGQDVSFGTKFRYKSATDRTNFENVADQTASLTFADGVNTGVFDFGTKGKLSNVDDDLPLDNAAYQAVGHSAVLDPTSANLITYTQTP